MGTAPLMAFHKALFSKTSSVGFLQHLGSRQDASERNILTGVSSFDKKATEGEC